jgi:hypothetical protein
LEIWVESAAQFNSLVEIFLLKKKKKKKKGGLVGWLVGWLVRSHKTGHIDMLSILKLFAG